MKRGEQSTHHRIAEWCGALARSELRVGANQALLRAGYGTKLPKDVGQSMRESVMAKAEATVEELVGMIERGELRLPEMQRRYVWRSTRVRDLLDSLYRGYPSGAILLWETDGAVPLQEFAVAQQGNPYQSTRLLLDGQQRLTSLSAVIRGGPVNVRVRKRPIELLFNLEHPEKPTVVTEVNEEGEDDELIDDEADSTDDELQKRFDRITFVVATRKLEQLSHWVKVTEVFASAHARFPCASSHIN